MSKVFRKHFCDWFFLAEKEYNKSEKFEEKYRIGLNIFRVIALLSIICLSLFSFSWLMGLFDSQGESGGKNGWIFLTIPVVYSLIVLFKEWIKELWKFLKKEPVVHYLFMGIIPAVLVFLGFQYFVFRQPVIIPEGQIDLVGRLTGFYSSLFTAVAIIAAIAALSVWHRSKDIKEKLDKFEKFEEKVNFIKEKKELAEWAQNKFDKDVEKKIITSTHSDLTEEDKVKFREVEKSITDEATDDSWLKMLYAKQLFDSIRKNGNHDEDEFIKIENIHNYIECRDLLKEDSDIRGYLFNYRGQLYRWWYKCMKKEFQNEKINRKKKQWSDWWVKGEYGDEKKHNGIDLLNNACKHYKTALKISKKAGEKADETLGNLAVVLIELAKFGEEEDRKKHLEEAKIYLSEREEDFNTYWDRARVLYYFDSDKNKDKIKTLLEQAVEEIDNIEVKRFFIETLKSEAEEKLSDGRKGFPGSTPAIKRLKASLDKKNLS